MTGGVLLRAVDEARARSSDWLVWTPDVWKLDRPSASTGEPTDGVAFPLTSATVVVGREPSCSLVFNEATVGRFHAAVHEDDGRRRVEDLGARNGTALDGVQLDSGATALLEDGAVLTLGRISLEYLTGETLWQRCSKR